MRKNNKGFTLIEMLIVVAIIAILVAVSIPMVNNSLERSREATDEANERAFKAAIMIEYLNNDDFKYTGSGHLAYYDAANGTIKDSSDGIAAYGKNTTVDGGTGYDSTDTGKTAHTDMILRGYLDTVDNQVHLGWFAN